MVNFVYFLWNTQGKQSQFFGIKEWENLHDIPDQCKIIIKTAFHDPNYNRPLNLESVNTIIPNSSILEIESAFQSRQISLLYYCDYNGLDDNYFSNLGFKSRTSSLDPIKILLNCTLSNYFNRDRQTNNSHMNLFLMIDPSRNRSYLEFLSSKDFEINFEYLNLKTLKLHEIASDKIPDKNLIIKLSSNKIDSIQPSTCRECD